MAGREPRDDEQGPLPPAAGADPTLTVAYEGTPPPGAVGEGKGPAGDGRPRFATLRPHARGGLGEVFLAFDAELRRTVAVKELRPERAHDPASQARFVLEAEITGRLEHPGIVPVYSLSRHADGRPYYAMRLVEGGTLRDAIGRFYRGEGSGAGRGREGRELAFRRLLGSVIDACNTVAYAHSRGVVHRDLKPENIMLGPFGETLVVDWGVAKLLDADADADAGEGAEAPAAGGLAADPSITRPGALVGTPRYMSPEQAAGETGRVGPASDVYGLGAILYCVLAGRDAFAGGDTPTVLDRVRRGIFPAPRRLRRSIDPALEAICLKAMAPEPGGRHASALELAGELEAWLADVRYRGEQERAIGQARGSLARLGLERAHRGFGRGDLGEGMLWLARALEDAPAEPPDLARAIRTSLAGWHLGSRLLERRFRHGGAVQAAAFCPEGRRLATAGGDGTARVWDVATGSPLCPPLSHGAPVRAVAFRPDGGLLATAADDGTIRLWDALTGAPVGGPIRTGGPVIALAFSPDGSRIAAAGGPADAVLWDLPAGTPARGPGGPAGRCLAVAFAPDGATLAVACEDGGVRLMEAATGAALGEPLDHGAAVGSVAFDPAGGRLLAGGRDGGARLWDLSRREAVATLGTPGVARLLAFRDGQAFAAAADGDAARLWDAARCRPIGGRLEHGARVDCLAFRPDGMMVASGSRDGLVRLWCAETALPIGPPLEHGAAVRWLAFSPDGGRLAASGPDATVLCWAVPGPVEADPERVSCWVRVTTNLEFDEGDAVRPMDGATGWDLRRLLNELGGPPMR